MGRTKTKTADQPTLIADTGKGNVTVMQKGAQQVPAVTGPDALFAVIERASRDNSVDLDRMQKLIDMHKELKADNARAEYDAAMAEAQSEMKTIKTNKSNSHTSSKYASYEAMDKAIRPIYTAHGFAMSFNTGDAPKADDVRVLVTVSHRGGHREQYKLDVPADGKGPRGDNVMTKTHAAGSAISYGKRYLAGMVWNLSVGDDDDGNGAASIPEKAKAMADSGIQYLNTAKPDKAALEAYRVKQEKNIAWLKKNAPEEFERFQTAYSNAAEAAGIKKEEPKRGNQDQSSTAASPHSGPKKDGQPATPKTAGAGGDRKSEAASTPALTDVEDLNDTIEFDTFATAREFLDFSSSFMADPKRTAAQAQQWYIHYRVKIDEYLKHEFPGKKVSWIKDSMVDTFAQYVKITSGAQAE